MGQRTGPDMANLFRGRTGSLREVRTLLQDLALAALTSPNGACYIQKGGILTPPAYGTLGNATRGLFVGPKYINVDIALEKLWQIKERYSVQFRIECYNCLTNEYRAI